MEGYPRTQLEFEAWFATEQSCREYLFRLRWPAAFECSRCRERRGWLTRRGLTVCAACGYQSSVTAGTVFQDTHKPLSLWFRAMWLITSQKTGASALGVQRVLGLGSYQTAWAWLHKLRRAMVRPGRDRLSGRVEVDECYWGAATEGWRGRHLHDKALIIVAAEQTAAAGIGRIRVARIEDGLACHVESFILGAVQPGSTICTDGWASYGTLTAKGYAHDVVSRRMRGVEAARLLPGVHTVISLLKRWLLATHQGAISHEHLEYYLDEFTFRFNRRTSHSRGKLFHRLVQQAVQIEPVPYRHMVKHVREIRRAKHNR